jgi:hypothetical protein
MSKPGREATGERPDSGGAATVIDEAPPIAPVNPFKPGFRSYLRHYRQGSPRWEALYKAIERLIEAGILYADSRFKADDWALAISRLGPDDLDEYEEGEVADLIETLFQVSVEWRLDRAAKGSRPPGDDVVLAALSTRCRYVIPGSGASCNRSTVPGTSRCRDHGGTLVDEKTRRAVLMGAYLGLVDATDLAVSTLSDVALNGRNELARVQAARELLDRAGLTADLNVTVRIEGDERTSRIEALQTRLDTMGTSLRSRVAGAIEAHADEHVTVGPEQDDVTVAETGPDQGMSPSR